MSAKNTLVAAVAALAEEYRSGGDRAELITGLLALAKTDDAEALVAAAEPYKEVPEIAGPLYERVVELQPENARALVSLASAYWLTGRGPEVVGEIAERAIAADPTNRGAWHMWALTESDQRERTIRWRQVSQRFPEDDLARANVADNAASLASAEHDKEALALAIAEYETLLSRASDLRQREALEQALMTLRGWNW
jgi:tetratricopeptide (TPR) repeat protein